MEESPNAVAPIKLRQKGVRIVTEEASIITDDSEKEFALTLRKGFDNEPSIFRKKEERAGRATVELFIRCIA